MSEPSPFRLAVAEDVLLSRSFSRDDLLVHIMLHWVTGAIGSSFWPYYSRQHSGWPLPAERPIAVPTAYQSFPKDILHPPRALGERAFKYSALDTGRARRPLRRSRSPSSWRRTYALSRAPSAEDYRAPTG